MPIFKDGKRIENKEIISIGCLERELQVLTSRISDSIFADKDTVISKSMIFERIKIIFEVDNSDRKYILFVLDKEMN